jgi:hypothetical protein
MIQQVETAILDALRQAFPDYAVEPYPGSPQDYTFDHARAALVPVLQEVQYTSGRGVAGTGRLALPEFNVALFARGLSTGTPSSYELLAETEDALEGLELGEGPEYPPLRIQRQFFITSRPGGAWVWGQNYKPTWPKDL